MYLHIFFGVVFKHRFKAAARHKAVLLADTGHKVEAPEDIELVVKDIVDRIPQAEAGQQQGRASGDTGHRHEEALFIPEEVAHRHLAVEGKAAPDRRDIFEQHPLARLGSLGQHEPGGRFPQRAAADLICGKHDAGYGRAGGKYGIAPVEGGIELGQSVHYPIGVPDDGGEYREPGRKPDGTARDRR